MPRPARFLVISSRPRRCRPNGLRPLPADVASQRTLLLGFHVGDESRLKTQGYGGYPMNVYVHRRQPDQVAAWLAMPGSRSRPNQRAKLAAAGLTGHFLADDAAAPPTGRRPADRTLQREPDGAVGTQRPRRTAGFAVLPRRRRIERTLGWITNANSSPPRPDASPAKATAPAVGRTSPGA